MSRRKLTAQAALASPVGILVQDTSSTTGAGLSGLTHTTPGLVMEYRREGQSTWTSVSLVAGTLGTFTSGGIVVDGALAGAYEIGIPNAAFAVAAGVRWVKVRLRGATNMLPVLMEFELDRFEYQNPAPSVNVTQWLNYDALIGPGDVPIVYTQEVGTGGINGNAIVAGALIGKGDWPVGKTGYELTATERTNIRSAIDASTILAKEATVSAGFNNTNNLITALNNLSAKMNIFGPAMLEIPDTGTVLYGFSVVVRDDEDRLVNLDAVPTIAAANIIGTNRSANLSVVSNPSVGRYTFTYSVANTHAKEPLRITVSGTVSAEARYIEWIGVAVDYDTLTTLQDVQTRVINMQGRLPTSLVGGRMDSIVGAMATGVVTETAIANSAFSGPKFAPNAIRVASDEFGNTFVIPNLAQASQIPSNFTPATFSAPGVFATSALVNAPSGGGGGNSQVTIAIPQVLAHTAYNLDEVIQFRGVTWSMQFTDLGNLSNISRVFFTLRKKQSDFDPESVIQVDSSTGLVVNNGSPAIPADISKASVAINLGVNNNGFITLTVNADITRNFPIGSNFSYDIKGLTNTGNVVMIVSSDKWKIFPDVTRRIS